MDFSGLDQFITERNRTYERMIWGAFRDRGYSKEWVIENADRIHINEYPNTRTFLIDEEAIFSVTQNTRIETNGGRYAVYVEYSITHL